MGGLKGASPSLEGQLPNTAVASLGALCKYGCGRNECARCPQLTCQVRDSAMAFSQVQPASTETQLVGHDLVSLCSPNHADSSSPTSVSMDTTPPAMGSCLPHVFSGSI